jgi:enoyl-CoA hydratase/carnithine racemase
LKWGLVSQIHPKDQLVEQAVNLAARIAKNSQIALASGKRAINQSFELGESAAIDHERSLFIGLMNTEDKAEGTAAFL